mgnify:CR=1 FL=1
MNPALTRNRNADSSTKPEHLPVGNPSHAVEEYSGWRFGPSRLAAGRNTMKSPLRQRALAVLAGSAVALSTAAIIAPAANAATNSYAYSASRWLEDQLNTEGLIHNPNYGGFDDYGLSLDVFFVLNDLGVRGATQTKIVNAVKANADNYIASNWGGIETFYPGAAGKLALAVKANGGDPANVNGTNLITKIEQETDDTTGESTNTYGLFGQTFATRALLAGDSAEAAKSVEFVASKQCENGSFKQNLAAACTAVIEVDTTVVAARTLIEAKDAGITGLEDEIAKATAALLAAQQSDGSFIGNDVSNSNSTGLAAAYLAQVGKTGAAGSAAGWLVKHQVTDAVAEAGPLASETGAIAYDATALTAGLAGGITDATRDQWIRATTGAVVGVNAQLPASTVALSGQQQFTAAGSTVKVTATGLTAGEKFTAKFAGGAQVAGTVPATGPLSVTLTAPAGTAVRQIVVAGARANRVGSVSTTVLGAAKVKVSVAKAKVKRGKSQKVTIKGLAAGEPVKVYLRGKQIKTGKANKSGTFKTSIKVGKKTGNAKITVKGAFANRKGAKTFTVVK